MKDSLFNPPTNKKATIRIAPVCNGKIYVVPKITPDKDKECMDLPMEEHVEHWSPNSDKAIRKINEKYHAHIHTSFTPRFSVQYKSQTNEGGIIYLYILPLKEENEIQFHNGKFVTEAEIAVHEQLFCKSLQKEREILGMAAELWQEFFLKQG